MEDALEKLKLQCQDILKTRYQSKSRLAIDLLAIIRPQSQDVKNQLLALVLQKEPLKFCECPKCSLLNQNTQEGLIDQRFKELQKALKSQIEEKIINIFKTGGSIAEKSAQVRKMIFSFHDFDEQVFCLLILQQTIFIPYHEVPQINEWSETEVKKILEKVVPLLPQLVTIYQAPQYKDDLHIITAVFKFLQKSDLNEREKTVVIAFLFTKVKEEAQKKACQECPVKKFHEFISQTIGQAIEKIVSDHDLKEPNDSDEPSSNSPSGKFNPDIN